MEDWTRDEFLAYVLMFAAKADFSEGQEETEFIKDEVGEDIYDDIHEEIEEDNDAQRIAKILDYVNASDFDKEYADMLYHEISDLFMADGEFNTMEKNLRRVLKRILTA